MVSSLRPPVSPPLTPPCPLPPVTWNSFLHRCCSTLSTQMALCSQCNALGSATGLRTGRLETSHLHEKIRKTIPSSPVIWGLALRSRGLPRGYRNATLFKSSPPGVAEWWAHLWLYLTWDLYNLDLMEENLLFPILWTLDALRSGYSSHLIRGIHCFFSFSARTKKT